MKFLWFALFLFLCRLIYLSCITLNVCWKHKMEANYEHALVVTKFLFYTSTRPLSASLIENCLDSCVRCSGRVVELFAPFSMNRRLCSFLFVDRKQLFKKSKINKTQHTNLHNCDAHFCEQVILFLCCISILFMLNLSK